MLSGMFKKIAVPSFPKINYAWVFVLMWAMLIFWLSHQPKTNFVSAQPSTLIPSYSDLLFAAIGLDGDTVVSKTAHVLLFGMLAWLVWRATRQWYIALLFTLSYAMFDEWHQSYIPGRTGRITDVLIDTLAALVLLGVLHCRRGSLTIPKFESDLNRSYDSCAKRSI